MSKKGVPVRHIETFEQHRQRLAAMLRGIPATDAVEQGAKEPEKQIEYLEETIRIYERRLTETEGDPADLLEQINAMRRQLLTACEELLPKAKAAAKGGKPALLRLISRIVKASR